MPRQTGGSRLRWLGGRLCLSRGLSLLCGSGFSFQLLAFYFFGPGLALGVTLPRLPIGLLRLFRLLLGSLLLLGGSALGLFIEFSIPPTRFIFLFFRHPSVGCPFPGGRAGLLCRLRGLSLRLPSRRIDCFVGAGRRGAVFVTKRNIHRRVAK